MYNKILLSHKKENNATCIILCMSTWMDLENIMLTEISQRKTNTVEYQLYVESKKQSKQTSEYNKTEKDSQI